MTQNVVPAKCRCLRYDGSYDNKKIRRHTDEDGVVIGMVSIGDVVNRMIKKYQTETEMMRFK